MKRSADMFLHSLTPTPQRNNPSSTFATARDPQRAIERLREVLVGEVVAGEEEVLEVDQVGEVGGGRSWARLMM